MLAPGTLYVVCRDKFLYAFKENDGDLNGDGVVDQPDLLEVVHNLGLCDDPDHCPWDVHGDGIVNCRDVAAVATHFGPCPNE